MLLHDPIDGWQAELSARQYTMPWRMGGGSVIALHRLLKARFALHSTFSSSCYAKGLSRGDLSRGAAPQSPSATGHHEAACTMSSSRSPGRRPPSVRSLRAQLSGALATAGAGGGGSSSAGQIDPALRASLSGSLQPPQQGGGLSLLSAASFAARALNPDAPQVSCFRAARTCLSLHACVARQLSNPGQRRR